MGSNQFYEHKKTQFRSIFKKDADSNVSEFLKYISIEVNRDLLDELGSLKDSIGELTQSNYKE